VSKRFPALPIARASLLAFAAVLVLAARPVRAEDKGPVTLAPDKPAAAPAATPAPATAAAKKKGPKAPKPPEPSLEEQRAADGLWAKRTSWLSLRAGYAKATGNFAGDGVAGYGMAYQHMLTNRWGFGGSVHHELLGHLGSASEIAVPFTLELTRHFKWQGAMRPYAGFGAGYWFHKYYRTGGTSTGSPARGIHFSLGGNMPLDERHLLGIDARMAFLSVTKDAVNPVFGKADPTETVWSIKLNWAFAY
jgi:hypothetical protein